VQLSIGMQMTCESTFLLRLADACGFFLERFDRSTVHVRLTS
jgi:hypothetical protein